jgi:hypothetical protein
MVASVALVAAAVAGPLRGQDQAVVRLDVNDLVKPEAGGWENRKVTVDAKWGTVFGTTIMLEKIPRGRVVIGNDPDEKLLNALLSNKTLDKKPLEKKKSNVRLFGRTAIDQSGEPILMLDGLEKLADDEDEYKGRVEEAQRKPQDKQTPDEFYKIARDATARAAFYGIDLKTWITKANSEGIKLEIARRRKGDAKDAIRLGKRAIEITGDTEESIRLFGEVALDPKADAADKEEAQKLLKANHAYFTRGEYVSYAKFKSSIGYVARGGKWVRRERAEFEDSIEKELKNPNPVRVGFNYEEYVTKGKVVRGMKKDEVVRTKGYGFPIFVDRKRMVRPKTNDTVTWDQWVFESGARVYFLNGEECEEKAKGTAWPVD